MINPIQSSQMAIQRKRLQGWISTNPNQQLTQPVKQQYILKSSNAYLPINHPKLFYQKQIKKSKTKPRCNDLIRDTLKACSSNKQINSQNLQRHQQQIKNIATYINLASQNIICGKNLPQQILFITNATRIKQHYIKLNKYKDSTEHIRNRLKSTSDHIIRCLYYNHDPKLIQVSSITQQTNQVVESSKQSFNDMINDSKQKDEKQQSIDCQKFIKNYQKMLNKNTLTQTQKIQILRRALFWDMIAYRQRLMVKNSQAHKQKTQQKQTIVQDIKQLQKQQAIRYIKITNKFNKQKNKLQPDACKIIRYNKPLGYQKIIPQIARHKSQIIYRNQQKQCKRKMKQQIETDKNNKKNRMQRHLEKARARKLFKRKASKSKLYYFQKNQIT